ncbi:transposase, partial [Enterococcus faecalis]|uniref:transposase n=1 Tax=Enterococcus faecalis TaxID=1351 RepID=UPI003CC6C50E
DIAATVEDIYGVDSFHEMISDITDAVLPELEACGVEAVFFISMDGGSGLEEGAKAIFPSVIVQRCMVHLVRKTLCYISSKDYKEVCREMKKFYGASSLNAAHVEFDSFQNQWSHYSGAVDIWKRNFAPIEQLVDSGRAIRNIMYT